MIKNIEAIKEIVATLNLESETTLEIVKEIMPLLWWKFIWLNVLWGGLVALLIAFVVGIFSYLILTGKIQ